MDIDTSTKEIMYKENQTVQENILLDIIKQVCDEPNTKLSQKLVGKVKRIIADCDLTHHASFHKLVTSNENTTTVLGFIHQAAIELTFDEQAELNQAIVNKIEDKIPIFTSELENLRQTTGCGKKSRNEQVRELRDSLDEKLKTLSEQENEKVELMIEWLNHRLQDVSTFSTQTTELVTLKTRILELKSKIFHLRILCSIFTETSHSIKAYSEIYKDINEALRDTEQRIQEYRNIIGSDM